MEWFVVGGWALDLFLESQSRDHQDLEIGIYRSNQDALKHYLRKWKFSKISNGALQDWNDGEWLTKPIHEIHGRSQGSNLEILLQEEAGAEWVFRRNEFIRRAKTEIILRTKENVPYLSPEVVLLFKAKELREKDEQDYRAVRDRLDAHQRDWLRSSLHLCHPGHSWLQRL